MNDKTFSVPSIHWEKPKYHKSNNDATLQEKKYFIAFQKCFHKNSITHKKSKVNTLIYKQKGSEEKHQCVVPTTTTI